MLAIRMRKKGLRWNFRNDAHICIENATYEQDIMFFSPDHLRFSANHAIMKAREETEVMRRVKMG